jgi:nucleolar GTP-binding protein
MFKKLPIVLSSQQLLDRAFKKTKKIQIIDRNALYRKKKTIIAKTESFSNFIVTTLENYVKFFPSIDNLPMFYQDIIEIKINKDKLKKSLGAIDWAKKTSQMIYTKQSKMLRKTQKIDILQQKQKEIYGRITSVVKQIKKELDILAYAQNIMRVFPELYDIPTIVIAGYPNVGKSSLIRCLSKAKPKIAQYPFTTKEIQVGHIEIKEKHITKRFQIVDTPGLLDRPFSKRNEIELQAIAALKNLANVIVFILDPSETCGYSLSDQKNLCSQLKKMFNESKLIIVENKTDIKNIESKNLKISCETKKGIKELTYRIFSFLK